MMNYRSSILLVASLVACVAAKGYCNDKSASCASWAKDGELWRARTSAHARALSAALLYWPVHRRVQREQLGVPGRALPTFVRDMHADV